ECEEKKEIINCKEEDNSKKEKKELIGKEFKRTYNINHIAPSNDYDYIYITIRGFQAEEIETVKVKRNQFEEFQVGDNVEITFKIESGKIEDNLKSIFQYSNVISATKTDKTGLEQINDTF
ncbi:MAG: hypothetical protein IKE70_02555, partial [Bacilli bacterium]|nr:hypothetical protein [Bacilli bacterium]